VRKRQPWNAMKLDYFLGGRWKEMRALVMTSKLLLSQL